MRQRSGFRLTSGEDTAVRLTISLRRDEFGELLGLAQAERRRPAEQAAQLVAEALKQRSTPETRRLIPAPALWDAPKASVESGAA